MSFRRKLAGGSIHPVHRFAVASGLIVVFIAGVCTCTRADDASTRQRIAQFLEGMHGGFADMAEAVGGLSPAETTKVDALEKSIAAKLKADPKPLDRPGDLREQVTGQFRAVLTPEHQAKLDGMLHKSQKMAGDVQTGARLKQVGLMLIDFAEKNKNHMLPHSLGDLFKSKDTSLPPDTFLANDSTTKSPDGFAAMSPAKQGEWVNLHTDFAFPAAGRTLANLAPGFVVAYSKPAGAKTFLLADGSVISRDEATSDQAVKQLNADQNPPDALSAK